MGCSPIKKKSSKNALSSTSKKITIPSNFYQEIIETENSFYENPTTEKIEKLLLLYKG